MTCDICQNDAPLKQYTQENGEHIYICEECMEVMNENGVTVHDAIALNKTLTLKKIINKRNIEKTI